ncbi:MAG: hypothetical protein AAF945_14420 [Actinomycetota bacterium]
MELSRITWAASIKLAAVISVVAALLAIAASLVSDLPQAAIVLPAIVIGFVASWVQTAHIHRQALERMVLVPAQPAGTSA